ncbi:Vacuolar protein sorting-associated protein 9a [Candida viswanathii]|uniref:Vacuolar protein sorting-associated protein 9a n=1 Tax=Candida viswanathii TaxID=5486 RepID=A0A367XWE2_9ASCO|nr:Vacuolar protein sorting-associated protein 9a [Candida viswanathii]
MSFNHLNFNISKATPTTSTSNTNTTSDSIANSHTDSPSSGDGQAASASSVKSPPFLQSILLKSNLDNSPGSQSQTASPPSLAQQQLQQQQQQPPIQPTAPQTLTSSPKLTASSAVPAIVTINNSAHSSSNTTANSSKTDLIGLFDKFDINKEGAKKDETQPEGEPASEKYVEGEEEIDHEHKLEKMNLEEEEEEEEEDQGLSGETTKEIVTSEKEIVPEAAVTATADKDLSVEESSPKETTQLNDNLIDLGEVEVSEPSKSATFEHIEVHSDDPVAATSEKEETVVTSKEDFGVESPTKGTVQGDISDIEGRKEETDAVEEFQVKTASPVQESSTQEEQSAPNKPLKHRFQINDSEEQNKQSHKPFDFQNFLSQLRKKSADPIVRYIRSFLSSFIKLGHTFTAEQRMRIILDFKIFMNEKFKLYEPFASMDQIDLENSREGLEKLIMNRLHDLCSHLKWSSKTCHTFRTDELFILQLEKFSWINGSHLDIDMNDLANTIVKGNQSFLDYAITELNKINNYRAPRDKIICILNSCKIIFSYLKLRRQETNADSFIPILILVIFKAKTDNLISNIHYIENFRGDEWLSHGETSYYLSSIQGAISFIENLSAEDLTISQKEFDAHMEAWEAQKKQRDRQLKLQQPIPTTPNTQLAHPDNRQQQQQQSLSPSNDLFPSSVLLSSAEMVTKSITNFLSPLPQLQESEPEEFQPPPNPPPRVHPQSQPLPPAEENDTSAQYQPLPPREEEIDSDKMKQAYDTLKEIFPTLDTNILKDVIFINRGNVDVCIDSCLQLVDG